MKPESRAAQGIDSVDPSTRALVPPIHPSTTFERAPDGSYPGSFEYSRADNPTYDPPERLLADLEGGDVALLFSSGMAASTSIMCSLVPGDHVVLPKVMYWALRKWISEFVLSWGIAVTYVDTGDLAALERAIDPNRTRIVWIETPANPTWAITDIAGAADLAHHGHARLVVDSTVATPVHTRPLEHGADLVVHSATKFLNGHGDVLAGAVVAASDDPFVQRIRAWRRGNGAVPGGFEAWLLLRGMRTLFPRVRQSSSTALAIARHFEGDDRLGAVLYPGLISHPGHDVAAAQMQDGFSGMLSIRVKAGEAAAMETAARVRLFHRATSLGGTESLIEHRSSVEGPSTPIPADILRLSVGLEDPDDLIADLDRALEHGLPDEPVPIPPSDDFATLRRTVIARGGDLRDGEKVVAIGSPGAVEPVRDQLDLSESTASTPADVLELDVNPMVAAHGGSVRLVDHTDGVVAVELTGRCQGCAMAQVTVRQGVEALMKRHVVGVTRVIDLTDHSAGTDPFYPTKKR